MEQQELQLAGISASNAFALFLGIVGTVLGAGILGFVLGLLWVLSQ